jgi:hypothetical protein
MNNPTARRSILGLLALPFIGRAAGASAPAPAPAEPVPQWEYNGDDKPPRIVRTYDPKHPVAVELGRLYDLLRATHPAEIKAKRAILEHDELMPETREKGHPEWDKHCEESQQLRDVEHESEQSRRFAFFKLIHAVIAAHGGGTPWLSEWYRYGTAHRVVRTGDRVYSVCPCYDAEWPKNEDCDDDDLDDGMVELCVIDL